jgi:hypothetical protein
LAVSADAAASAQLDYAGRYAEELAQYQDLGLGNCGSSTEDIVSQLGALFECGAPQLTFHPMCGVGRWAEQLERIHGGQYVGMDISTSAVLLAQGRNAKTRCTVFQLGDIMNPWPKLALGADTLLLTFEALNFFPPSRLAHLWNQIGRMQRLSLILINLRHPFPTSKNVKLGIAMCRRHPLSLGSALSIEIARCVWHDGEVGIQHQLVAITAAGIRRTTSTLWKHQQDAVKRELKELRFTVARQLDLETSITLVCSRRS